MNYFDHDTMAGSDDKIIALRMDCGGAAVDAYWTILESIYRNETELVFEKNRTETKAVCFRLQVGFEQLSEWCEKMENIGLLETRFSDGVKIISSKRAMENIAAYREKRETARQNGKKGGRKPTRKPKANQGGKSVATDAETKALPIKEKKVVGSYIKEPTTTDDSHAADAAEAAPRESVCPSCPLCGARMTFDPKAAKWRCTVCLTEADEAVML